MLEKPACHGLATCVSAQSPTCQVCPVSMSCLQEAERFLASLPDGAITQRERLNLSVTRQALVKVPQSNGQGGAGPTVVASTRGVQRIALSAGEQKLLEGLPARVASAARQLMERGWFAFARAELMAGRNPAPKGWKHVFCQGLLQGGMTRHQLQMSFVQQLDLSPGSAKTQASIAVHVFAAGRLVREIQGRLVFTPN